MAYRLPVFNITVGIWNNGGPFDAPPDVESSANFAQGWRNFGGSFYSTEDPRAFRPTAYLLLPKGVDITGDTDTANDTGDDVEIPLGSGKFYHVIHQERSALGFANEHVVAVVVKKIDQVGDKGPAVHGTDGGILMESSGYVLMESGDVVIME